MLEYLGTLKIEVSYGCECLASILANAQPTSFKQTFTGRQLGPNEVLTKCKFRTIYCCY
jgi:hypothetical protein